MAFELPPIEVPSGWFAILEALRSHRVEYLIAGSSAEAIVESDPRTAPGLIIAPAPYRRNMVRIGCALRELSARQHCSDGRIRPFAPDEFAQRPGIRRHLQIGTTALDLIGSTVGDGEFSTRVWRTRAVRLTCDGMLVVAEVEFTGPVVRAPVVTAPPRLAAVA